MEWLHILIGVLSGGTLGGIIVNYIAVRKLRHETDNLDANTTLTSAQAWVLLVNSLQSRISVLEERETERESERQAEQRRIDDLEAEVEELRDWIKKQGLKPPERRERTRPLGKRETK